VDAFRCCNGCEGESLEKKAVRAMAESLKGLARMNETAFLMHPEKEVRAKAYIRALAYRRAVEVAAEHWGYLFEEKKWCDYCGDNLSQIVHSNAEEYGRITAALILNRPKEHQKHLLSELAKALCLRCYEKLHSNGLCYCERDD
jgi:hypothetical protein